MKWAVHLPHYPGSRLLGTGANQNPLCQLTLFEPSLLLCLFCLWRQYCKGKGWVLFLSCRWQVTPEGWNCTGTSRNRCGFPPGDRRMAQGESGSVGALVWAGTEFISFMWHLAVVQICAGSCWQFRGVLVKLSRACLEPRPLLLRSHPSSEEAGQGHSQDSWPSWPKSYCPVVRGGRGWEGTGLLLQMWAHMAGQGTCQHHSSVVKFILCCSSSVSAGSIPGEMQMSQIGIICKEAVAEGYFNAVALMASHFLLGKCVTN